MIIWGSFELDEVNVVVSPFTFRSLAIVTAVLPTVNIAAKVLALLLLPATGAVLKIISPEPPEPVPLPAEIVKFLPAWSVPVTACEVIVPLDPFPNVISLPVTIKSPPNVARLSLSKVNAVLWDALASVVKNFKLVPFSVLLQAASVIASILAPVVNVLDPSSAPLNSITPNLCPLPQAAPSSMASTKLPPVDALPVPLVSLIVVTAELADWIIDGVLKVADVSAFNVKVSSVSIVIPVAFPLIYWLSSTNVIFLPVAISISPSISKSVEIFTFPFPFGVISIFPFAPSVIVIDPVVLLPVFNVKSLSPFDLNTPAALPVPAETSPLIKTVPLTELVIVSSFSKIKPAEPVISTLVVATIVVKPPEDFELEPIDVPSIVPASISTLLIFTSPLPFGVISISPFVPSVIVIEPVVLLPVFNIKS